MPQTALSLCAPLTVVHREDVAPGTGLAVSADGRRLAQFFHTPGGAEILLRDRETSAVRRLTLAPPPLPPGVPWRIAELMFAAAGDLLLVASTGRISALSHRSGETFYSIDADLEKHLYPSQLALSGGRLAVAFWPAESYLAEAPPKQPVEVRLYEAHTGNLERSIQLSMRTADAWTRLVLSPEGQRLAVLMRATRWPGKARLALYRIAEGKLLWERKVSAEDVAWPADVGELLALGSELAWLDAATGKKIRAAKNKVRFSEHQRLRLNDSANAALAFFQRYNPLKRTLDLGDAREPLFLLWRLNSGQALCELRLDSRLRVEAWLTARGEILALEETYDLRPPLRILRAVRMVTYRLEK